MDEIEHLEFLRELEISAGLGLLYLPIPRAEGAFWWGNDLTRQEYAERYRAECKQRGWIDEQEG